MKIFAQGKPILKMGESRGIITIDLLPHYPDRAVELDFNGIGFTERLNRSNSLFNRLIHVLSGGKAS